MRSGDCSAGRWQLTTDSCAALHCAALTSLLLFTLIPPSLSPSLSLSLLLLPSLPARSLSLSLPPPVVLQRQASVSVGSTCLAGAVNRWSRDSTSSAWTITLTKQ